ncbi:unnamed protein product [Trichobilharzia regenti]|nr:unnamed protein product [Trichobilharzia regenti]
MIVINRITRNRNNTIESDTLKCYENDETRLQVSCRLGHLRNELMETVNQEPSESDSNLQDKSMIPSHSLSSASSSSPVNDSVSDHSISITDEINDNETQQPSKIHFTDDMKENHSK